MIEVEYDDQSIAVPRAFLSLLLDLLIECQRSIGRTDSNFDDDMVLAIGNLRSMTGQPNGTGTLR